MSTLTSLVKSGKRKITRKKTGQSSVEQEQSSIEAGQKPLENVGSDAPVKPALGRPDRAVSLDATRPRRRTLSTKNPALGQPDQAASLDVTRPRQDTLPSNNPVLSQPDEGVSPDVTRPQ